MTAVLTGFANRSRSAGTAMTPRIVPVRQRKHNQSFAPERVRR
jgi:hypothetical protein